MKGHIRNKPPLEWYTCYIGNKTLHYAEHGGHEIQCWYVGGEFRWEIYRTDELVPIATGRESSRTAMEREVLDVLLRLETRGGNRGQENHS